MSWRETRRPALLVVAALMLASCQVRPLYAPEASEAGAPARLAAVQIKPVTTREAQQVRNQLVFLLNGGAGEPDQAPHAVSLAVTAATTGLLATPVATTDDSVPTAATVTMTALYTITDTASGETVARGKRQAVASYDRPRQEFAALRAERDAQDRAARELAEHLRAAILQDLASP